MKSILEDIKRQEFRNAYLLFGVEEYLIRQYRDKLKAALAPDDAMNITTFEGNDVDFQEVSDLAQTLPFFAERRVIVLHNTGIMEKASSVFERYWDEPSPTTYFVISETKVDKRTKNYKLIAQHGHVVSFQMPEEVVLRKWIQSLLQKEELQMTQEAMQRFLDMTGSDMENMYQEMQKLIGYSQGKSLIEVCDVEAICTVQISNRVYAMIDAMGQKDVEKVVKLYQDLLALKEPAMRTLFQLSKHFHQLLQVKDMKEAGFRADIMAETMKIPKWSVDKLSAQARLFDKRVLRQAMVDCLEAEEAIKSGRMTDRLSVELILVKYATASVK